MFAIAAKLTRTALFPGSGSRQTAALAGLLDAAAAVLFIYASHAESLPIVVVLVSLYPGITVLAARVINKERLRRPQLGGLCMACVAVSLLVLAR